MEATFSIMKPNFLDGQDNKGVESRTSRGLWVTILHAGVNIEELVHDEISMNEEFFFRDLAKIKADFCASLHAYGHLEDLSSHGSNVTNKPLMIG